MTTRDVVRKRRIDAGGCRQLNSRTGVVLASQVAKESLSSVDIGRTVLSLLPAQPRSLSNSRSAFINSGIVQVSVMKLSMSESTGGVSSTTATPT